MSAGVRRRQRRHGRRRGDRQDPGRQLAGVHVRVEHRHELVEVREQLVAEDRRVRGALAVLDERRLEDDADRALHLDRPLEHLDGHEVQAERVGERDRLLRRRRARRSARSRCGGSSSSAARGRPISSIGHLAGRPPGARSRSGATGRPPRTRSRRRRRSAGSRRGRTASRRTARTAAPSRSGPRPSTSGTIACSRPRLERVVVVHDEPAVLAVEAVRPAARASRAPCMRLSPAIRRSPGRARRRSSVAALRLASKRCV